MTEKPDSPPAPWRAIPQDASCADAREVGRRTFGPFLVAFCRWLRMRAPETAALLFLSRDSDLILAVWRLLFPHSNASYFLMSRAAAALAMLDGPDSVAALADGAPRGQSVADVLRRRLRLAAGEAETLCGPAAAATLARSRRGAALLRAGAPALLSAAEAHRRGLCRAFEEAAGACAEAVVVDIGYRGIAQQTLARVLKRPVGGRYVLTHRASRVTADQAGSVIAFAGARLHPADFRSTLNRSRFVLETVLSAETGSFLRWDADGRPRFARYEEPESSRRIRRAIRCGALDHARAAAQTGAPGDATALIRFLEIPDPRLVASMADLVFDGGAEDLETPLLCADPATRPSAYALWIEGQAALDRSATAAPSEGVGAALLRQVPEAILRRTAPAVDRLQIATNAALYLRSNRDALLSPFRALERIVPADHRRGSK